MLHDDIGQVLSGVGLQLEALRLDLKDQPQLASCAAALQGSLEQAMSRVRELSNELNPSVVERAGLQFSMERLAERYRGMGQASVRLHFDPAVRLPRAIAAAFYRVAEYAFEHALRRAHASQVEVHVKPAREATILEVRYNGASAEAALEAASRVELLKLQYHARRAGISIKVEFSPEKGTIVRTSYNHSGTSV